LVDGDDMKILALESHYIHPSLPWVTSGVDYARIVNPMKHLAKVDGFEVDIRKDPFTKQKNWNEITKYYDAIYTSYLDSDWGYVALAVYARMNNCKVVIDLDDNIWKVDKSSPVYKSLHPGSWNLYVAESVLADVEYLTTTNTYLRYRICEHCHRRHDQVKVFPNYIDLDLYHYEPKPRTGSLVIQYHGSSTHFKDLMDSPFVEGLGQVLKEFPEVKFQTVGMFLPQLKTRWGRQYAFKLGERDFDKWVPLWNKLEADIVVAPLHDSEFSKSKSPIKYLENSAHYWPGVYQNIRQYKEVIKQGKTGFLASTSDDWYTYLKTLIQNPELRQQIGYNAYQDIVTNWQIKNHVEEYAEYFLSNA
jgi:glycosyltransferase involved in cell wall biosynthesis